MTLTDEYQQSDVAASEATKLAKKNQTALTHKDAAGKHYVAAILARNIGDEKAIEAHESQGEAHHRFARVLEASGDSKATCQHLNEDGTFKGGFDGCVLHMQAGCGGGHSEESAKKICGSIAQNTASAGGKTGLQASGTSEGAVKAWETRHGGMSYGDLNKASTDASQRATDMAHDALRQKDNNGAYARTVDAHTNAARTHEQAAQAAEAAGNKDAAAYHRHMEFMHKAHANWAESMAEGKGGHLWRDMAQDSSRQAQSKTAIADKSGSLKDHATARDAHQKAGQSNFLAESHSNENSADKMAARFAISRAYHRKMTDYHNSKSTGGTTERPNVPDHMMMRTAIARANHKKFNAGRAGGKTGLMASNPEGINQYTKGGMSVSDEAQKKFWENTHEGKDTATLAQRTTAAHQATQAATANPTAENHAAAADAHTTAAKAHAFHWFHFGKGTAESSMASDAAHYHKDMAKYHAAQPSGNAETLPPQMPDHISRLLAQKDVETPTEREHSDDKLQHRLWGDSANYAKNAKVVKALQAAATVRMSANAQLQAAMSDSKISFSDLQQRLSSLCQDIPMLNDDSDDNNCVPCSCWPMDIILEDGNWKAIVNAPGGCLYEVPFTIADGEVDISGDPVEVERTTDYVEVATDGYETALTSASAKGSEAKFNSQAEQDKNAKENLHESGGAPTVDGDETFCCPNCGHEFEDSDDVAGGDSGQMTCPSCQKPFKVESTNASKRQALEAASAKAAQTRYRNAAVEASDASVAVAKAHSDAASLHNIAKEHALMCGYQPESFMHGAKAKEHLDACEACNASTVPHSMPART